MYYTYILKSKKNGKYYIGYSSNLKERLRLHNLNRNLATKGIGPWKLFYFEEFENESDAIKREKQIKSWKKRSMIEKLKF